MRRSAFSIVLVLALGLTLAFFLLPIAAVFLRVSPGALLDQLGRGVVVDALVVSAKTSLIAQAIIFLVGTPAAYLVARHRFRGRAFVLTLIELPLVLPPAVAGIGLLAAFGRLGLLGSSLDVLGVSIGFTQAAVVMAILLVAGPFYVRGAVGAFESLDQNLLDASRTLGAGPARTFPRVAIPLAARASARPLHCRLRAGWASSARHCSSPAACKASRRRSRSPSTRSWTSASTRRSPSAPCSSS